MDTPAPHPVSTGREPSPRHWIVLTICALVMLGCLLFWVRVLGPDMHETVPSHVGDVIPWVNSLWPTFVPWDDRGEDYPSRSITLPYCVILIVLFSAYGVALRTAAGFSNRLLTIAVFGTGAVFLAVLATLPFMYASDVYSYAAYGRMFTIYHIDPAVETFNLPTDDPYTKLWGEHLPPSSYGPLWTLTSAGVALLAAKKVGLTVLLYRGVAVFAALGAAALIANCLRRFAPARVAQGMLFFLWNPLVVLETATSGHNDVVMVALFLVGISLHLNGRRFLAVLFFSLSVLIKFATAPLVPIYLVMVLRQLPNWRTRGGFLVQASVAGILALAASVVPLYVGVRSKPAPAVAGTEPPTSLYGAWIFEQGYINSPHELLFRAIRQRMGEEPDDVRDVEFWGWWAAPTKPVDLRSTPAEDGPPVEPVKQGTPLLVMQPRVDHAWHRVYDPDTGKKGYISDVDVDAIERPAFAERDVSLLRWERGRSPTAVRADFVVKLAGWLAFGAAWLVALVYASDMRRFLLAATSLMLASYYLINTAFYAWYVIWALAFAALVPASAPALLAILLSATALTIYATTGFDDLEGLEWIFTYRSMPVFALPLMTFAAAYGVRYWRLGRSPDEGNSPPLSSPDAIQAR
jgi:hypothetical protein